MSTALLLGGFPRLVRPGDVITAAIAINATMPSTVVSVATTGGMILDGESDPVALPIDGSDDLIFAQRGRTVLLRLSKLTGVLYVPLAVFGAGTVAVDGGPPASVETLVGRPFIRRSSCTNRLRLGDEMEVDLSSGRRFLPVPAGLVPVDRPPCAVWRPEKLGFTVACGPAPKLRLRAAHAGTFAAPRRDCVAIETPG